MIQYENLALQNTSKNGWIYTTGHIKLYMSPATPLTKIKHTDQYYVVQRNLHVNLHVEYLFVQAIYDPFLIPSTPPEYI